MHEEGRPVLDRAPLTIASDGRAILPGFAVGAGGVLAERRVAMEVLTALGMGGENARVSIDASQARALLNYDKLAGPDADDEAGRRMVLTRASDIKPARVVWLWEGRLALGTLSLLAGRESLGKSTLGYWIAARITRGELPGESITRARSVMVCAAEDSWEHTIVPRLMASGADLDRVLRVEMVTADDIHDSLSLPRDLAAVERDATEHDVAMLILDPLMSRLSDKLDTHRDGDVRRALEPLVTTAQSTGMAVLGLIHHNKSGSDDPLQLVMGSRAFTAVARSVHTVIRDPEDESDRRRLFGTPKNNLGRDDLPTLAFTIEGYAVETDDGTQIVWGDEVAESITETMRRSHLSHEDRSSTSEAADWLSDYVTSQGGVAPSRDIKAAGVKEGHTVDALKRARRRLGFYVTSQGFPRVTFWGDEALCPQNGAVGAQSGQHA